MKHKDDVGEILNANVFFLTNLEKHEAGLKEMKVTLTIYGVAIGGSVLLVILVIICCCCKGCCDTCSGK